MRKPITFLKNIQELEIDFLADLGKNVLFLDADNTLFLPGVPLENQDLTMIKTKLIALKQKYVIIILSNNFSQDKQAFFNELSIETIFFAKKPLSFSFKKAHNLAQNILQKPIKKAQIMHLGDQFLTDGIGSVLYGIDYILVDPINEAKDLIYAKPSRILEKILQIRK